MAGMTYIMDGGRSSTGWPDEDEEDEDVKEQRVERRAPEVHDLCEDSDDEEVCAK